MGNITKGLCPFWSALIVPKRLWNMSKISPPAGR